MSNLRWASGIGHINIKGQTDPMMLTIQAISESLEQSSWRTWRLIWALKPIMKELCVSKPDEPFLFNPKVIAILKRAKELRNNGISIKQLEKKLRHELTGKQDVPETANLLS